MRLQQRRTFCVEHGSEKIVQHHLTAVLQRNFECALDLLQFFGFDHLARDGRPDGRLRQTGPGLGQRGLGGGDIGAETTALVTAISAYPGPVIVVSNEVGWGIVPDNKLSRDFRDAQGRLNQRLAEAADLVAGVMAGLPMVLKGQMPVLQ